MENEMNEQVLCKECQEKFEKQNGELLVLDMCEKCKERVLLGILK